MAQASSLSTTVVTVSPALRQVTGIPVGQLPLLGGVGAPSDTVGLDGQGYTDLVGMAFYMKEAGHWVLKSDVDDGDVLSDFVAYYILAKQ